MFSYTSAISKKWLAIVFRGLKLGNIRNLSDILPPPFPPFPIDSSRGIIS